MVDQDDFGKDANKSESSDDQGTDDNLNVSDPDVPEEDSEDEEQDGQDEGDISSDLDVAGVNVDSVAESSDTDDDDDDDDDDDEMFTMELPEDTSIDDFE